MENLAEEAEGEAQSGRATDLYDVTKTITNNGRRKTAAVRAKKGR